MTPEELRQFTAYLRMMMQSGQQPANIGADLFPTTNEKKAGDTNYFQDRVQMLGDPLTGALAGPGALDYSVFDPTYERNYLDEAPQGEVLMRQWKNSAPGSAKNVMYDLMYGDGLDGQLLDGMSAWNQVKSMAIPDDPDGERILASLPPGQINLQTGDFAKGTDSKFASLWGEVQDLESAVAMNTSGAEYDDATGRYYTETEVPSEMAAQFAEMMLPTPDQRYQPIIDTHEQQGYNGLGSQGYNAERNRLTEAMRQYTGANAPGVAERAAAVDKYGPMATTAQQDRAADWANNLTGQPNEMGVQGTPLPANESGGNRDYVPPSTAGGASLEDVPQEWRLPSERGPATLGSSPIVDMLMPSWGGGGAGGGEPSLWGVVGARGTGEPIGDTGIGGTARRPQGGGDFWNSDPTSAVGIHDPSGMLGGRVAPAQRRQNSRNIQKQMFQNSRDRMSSKGNRTISAGDMGALLRARDDGNTPFMDAIQQRMLHQQISGF